MNTLLLTVFAFFNTIAPVIVDPYLPSIPGTPPPDQGTEIPGDMWVDGNEQKEAYTDDVQPGVQKDKEKVPRVGMMF